jgi:AcrR family transcriptional regulator
VSTKSIDPSARPVGRPREARADRAIRAATLGLIAELGVSELRMSDVAGRAGVGKATIYRRYASKDELVTDALATLVSEIGIPDTGSTRADLMALMLQTVGLYSGSIAAKLMPALVEEVRLNDALARSLREGFLVGRRAALSEVLTRGVERGDLRGDLDMEFALDVLGGAVFYRLLITGGPIDDALARSTVELIMNGFATAKRRSTSSKTKEH